MSRICELTGKGRQVGHNVSHANNKTKRTFLPNLQNVTLLSDALGKGVKLRVSTHGLRSVEHNGGLDNWLMKTGDDQLSANARKLKKEVAKLDGEISKIDAKLGNAQFVAKAPEEVIEEQKERRAEALAAKAKLDAALARLATLKA